MALTKAKASNILLTTPAASSNDTTPATTQYVTTAIANLIDNAPANLNTLNELAAAMADNASFFSTVLPLSGGTMTGDLVAPNIKATTEFQIFAGGTDIGAIFNSGGALTIQGTSTRDVSIGSDSNTNAIFVEGTNGNVGIGTTNPTDTSGFGRALDVASGSGAGLYLRDTGDSTSGIIGMFNSNLSINSKASSGNIVFYSNDVQKGILDSSGALTVVGNVTATSNSGSQAAYNLNWQNDAIAIEMKYDSSYYMNIEFDASTRDFIFNNKSADSAGDFRFFTGASLTEKLTLTQAGRLGIGNHNPSSKLHIHGTSGQTNYTSHTNVDEYIATFQTSFNGTGSQQLHVVNHNGNWQDGTSGGDSAYGFMWGYENSIRAGIHYDHRGTEKFDFYSSYAPFRFRVPNSVNGNLSPIGTESTMRSALTVAIGGKVGVGTDSPRRHFHVHNPNAATTNIMITNSATGESNDNQGLHLGISSTGVAYVDNKEATNLQIISNGSVKQNILAVAQSNCHVDINGGVSLGIGNTSAAGDTGMNVKGWYNATAHNSNSYLHLNTSMWGGGSPHGNSMYIMGGWKVMAHQYATNNSYGQCTVFFHNWNGNVASGFSQTYGPGPWTGWMYVYVNSSGYVTIRLHAGTYRAYWLDYYQAPHYPARNTYVTAATFSNSATL